VIVVLSLFMLFLSLPLSGQTGKAPDTEALRAGRNFIATPVYSEASDQAVLKLFKGLRVADVVDGMDAIGLVDTGTMSPEIHALWRDTAGFTHRFVGIAVTARYVPTQQPAAGILATEAYDAWAGEWYDQRSPESFVPLIREGTAIVLEDAPETDVGSRSVSSPTARPATRMRSSPRRSLSTCDGSAAASGRGGTSSSRSTGPSSAGASSSSPGTSSWPMGTASSSSRAPRPRPWPSTPARSWTGTRPAGGSSTRRSASSRTPRSRNRPSLRPSLAQGC